MRDEVRGVGDEMQDLASAETTNKILSQLLIQNGCIDTHNSVLCLASALNRRC